MANARLNLAAHLESLHPPDIRPSLRKEVIPALVKAIHEVAEALRESDTVSQVGTANAFGDDQLNVDVLAEKIIRTTIAKCSSIRTASSEEDPEERPARLADEGICQPGTEQYTVAFDPLDGSSIIAPNWTVGTIIGIWDGTTALHEKPKDKLVAAILGLQGPRTTAIIALRIPGTAANCFEVAVNGQRITVIRPRVQFQSEPFKTRYFSPANLRAAAEDEKYLNLVSEYIKNKYTLRYSGGLVPDVVHALVKGHGVYISPVNAVSDAKLRRLYELTPIALIVECAGGLAIDPQDGEDILGRAIDNCDERGGLVCGTAAEVENVRKALL
ncbi:fructose-1-6-bisphosphatase [Trematosphaeria pertusa]|uniref:Fructose-1-6-bisphosphatase n=1 Tax=Trematosphaeria pertusa TaxID=390896 RepID=A0A6A6IPR9_9PLEO|nr:fructose-1-6-bisphosphatase [Trematosphaeria pertusa]KAF2252068.1 fructose-1-6-bisphosphatase [Trematosphaeria pertusa]